MLRCSNCGRQVEKLPEGRVRCSHCGSRMLFKPRPEVIRKVRAR
ncbi:MAG: DNA-directed RNA polymerase subunit P [Candidatus Hadarchaeaceae archaeon]